MLAPDALLLHLSSFKPRRPEASRESWLGLASLAPRHGLASLVAYNVEYRLAGAGAPQEVRDILLSHYQGVLSDNVFKLVNLKRMLAECPDRPVLLLDASAFADVLYPHIAFRPIDELRVLVHPADLQSLQRTFAQAGYRPRENDDPLGGAAVSSDDRTRLVLHTRLFSEARASREQGLWDRAQPARALGVAAFRPAMADALLAAVRLLGLRGLDVPLISLVDVRELVRGSPDLAGPYSHPMSAERVLSDAKAFRLDRALWCVMELVSRLFPESTPAVRTMQPVLRAATRALLERLVVLPAVDLQRTRAFRGAERLRRLFSGG